MGNSIPKSLPTRPRVDINKDPDFYWKNDIATRMTCSFRRPVHEVCIVHIIFEHPSSRIQKGKRIPDDELPEEIRPDFSSMYVPKDWSDSHFSTWPVELRSLCYINTGIEVHDFDNIIENIFKYYYEDDGLKQFAHWLEFWKPRCYGFVHVNFHE